MDPQASLVLNNGDQGQESKRRRMNVEPTGDQHAHGAPREALPGEPDMADHPGPTTLDLAASGAAAGLADEDVTKQEPATSVFVVPAFAGWFRWDKVHPLERKAVPEFFGQLSTAGHVDAFGARRGDGEGEQGGAERTPELYLEYRKSIINLHRARPSSTLSFTQVRRCLVGDVVALRRIFNMLNQWGIINSLVQPLIGGEAGALDSKGMRVSSSLIIPTTNGTQLKGSATLLAPPPATPLLPSRQTSAANSQQVRAILAAETSLSAALYPHPSSSPSVGLSSSGAAEGIAGLDSAPSLHTAPQVACNSCSGPCTPCYYTALRKEDCHLCSKCFAAGRFVEGLGELDFVLVVQDVVLGIDGGATSTECSVLPLTLPPLGLEKGLVERSVCGKGRGGSSNRNSIGEEKAKDALFTAINTALSSARLPRSAVRSVAACMAGVDRPQDITLVTSWLREWFPEPVYLAIHNDSVAALASGTLGSIPGLTPCLVTAADAMNTPQPSPTGTSRSLSKQEGALVVIAGTGSIVYGFHEDGRTARSSGAGPLLGDRGSGYSIASEALGAVMRAEDGRGPPTALSSAILDRLELSHPSDLIGWIYSDVAWSRVAALLPVVKQCAADGDKVALLILEAAVVELACGISAVASRLGLATTLVKNQPPQEGIGSFTLTAAGGVLQDRSVFDIYGRLNQRLLDVLPGAVLQLPQVEASVGAALVALRLCPVRAHFRS